MGQHAAGRYYIVAGERRFRAAQLIGLATLPCHLRPTLTLTAAVQALSENVHRPDLSELEKAESLLRIKTLTDKTWDEVAGVVGLSTDYVKRLAGLLKLEERVKQLVRENQLSTRVAIALRPLPARKQVEMAERAVHEGLTAEQIRDAARAEAAEPPRRPASRPSPEPSADGRTSVANLVRAVEQIQRCLHEWDTQPGKLASAEREELAELRRQVARLHQDLDARCASLEKNPTVED
jgi:ParB family chromosome partitioning protein